MPPYLQLYSSPLQECRGVWSPTTRQRHHRPIAFMVQRARTRKVAWGPQEGSSAGPRSNVGNYLDLRLETAPMRDAGGGSLAGGRTEFPAGITRRIILQRTTRERDERQKASRFFGDGASTLDSSYHRHQQQQPQRAPQRQRFFTSPPPLPGCSTARTASDEKPSLSNTTPAPKRLNTSCRDALWKNE